MLKLNKHKTTMQSIIEFIKKFNNIKPQKQAEHNTYSVKHKLEANLEVKTI